MKKYFAPELETAKFLAQDVISVSNGTARIIGGDTNTADDLPDDYNTVVEFDWANANWD